MRRSRFASLNRICQLSVLPLFFALVTGSPISAHAQTFQLIHSFTDGGTDGFNPTGAIYADSVGNIYGATEAGGKSLAGVIYQIDQNGNETILHNFGHNNEIAPTPGLALVNGTFLFGHTAAGGATNQGTVFAQQLSPPAFKNVHIFSGTDGADPVGILVLAADGLSAYGVTASGGANNAGEVYKVDKSGNVTVIYSFTGGSDGSAPSAGLLLDSAGNLYGVTTAGGTTGDGVFFRIDPSGVETVIHNFSSTTGKQPNSTPVADGLGNVYGTTADGGGNFERGVLYKLNLSTGNYKVVHTFQTGLTDGAAPIGDLAKDSSGHLYGMTRFGGSGTCSCGTVYQIDAAGNETVLHSFTNTSNDGGDPLWLYRDPATGFLYGVTVAGGTRNEGVLFRITR